MSMRPFGPSEQTHSNSDIKYAPQLMTEFCQLWNIDNICTTSYYLQLTGMVKYNNRWLWYSLWALLDKERETNPKIHPNFVGSYRIEKAYSNYSCMMENQDKNFVENDCRLTLYHWLPEKLGWAPSSEEHQKQLNMKVTARAQPKREKGNRVFTWEKISKLLPSPPKRA